MRLRHFTPGPMVIQDATLPKSDSLNSHRARSVPPASAPSGDHKTTKPTSNPPPGLDLVEPMERGLEVVFCCTWRYGTECHCRSVKSGEITRPQENQSRGKTHSTSASHVTTLGSRRRAVILPATAGLHARGRCSVDGEVRESVS